MVTAVNTQALASSASAGRAEKPDAEPQSRPLDTPDKADQQAVVVKISTEGASRAAAAPAPAPSADAAPPAPAGQDIDGDGEATTHEFRDGAPRAPQTRVSVNQQPAGAAPAGAQPRAGDAGGGGASPIVSSSQTYDPADINQDGTVSAQEGQAYGAKLAADKAAEAAASSNRTAEASAAVKAYQSVEQLGQAGTAA